MVNYSYEDELMHYGVIGMKWGVRRASYKDVRTAKKMRGHLAADKKMMKMYGKTVDESERNYQSAQKRYRKSVSKLTLSRKRRQANIEEASRELSDAGKKLSKDKADMLRANRIYNQDAKKLTEHVDGMKKKYGGENIKSLKTKDIRIGENYTRSVIKTGITMADIPLIGRIYTGHVYSPKEIKERRMLIDEESSKRY